MDIGGSGGALPPALLGSSYRDMLMASAVQQQQQQQQQLADMGRQQGPGYAPQQLQQVHLGGGDASAGPCREQQHALPASSAYMGGSAAAGELAAAEAALQQRILEAGLQYAPGQGGLPHPSMQQSWRSFAQSVQQASAGPSSTHSNDLLRPALALEQAQAQQQHAAQLQALEQITMQQHQQAQQEQQQLRLLQEAARLQGRRQQQGALAPDARLNGAHSGALSARTLQRAPAAGRDVLQGNATARCAGDMQASLAGQQARYPSGSALGMQHSGAVLSPEGHTFMSPSDWDPTYRSASVLPQAQLVSSSLGQAPALISVDPGLCSVRGGSAPTFAYICSSCLSAALFPASIHRTCGPLLCSDDQLLSEDAGAGSSYAPDRQQQQQQQQQQQRNASRGALLPRFGDQELLGSYSNSITSPAQPSPQGPYDLPWLRSAPGEASMSSRDGLHMQVGLAGPHCDVQSMVCPLHWGSESTCG